MSGGVITIVCALLMLVLFLTELGAPHLSRKHVQPVSPPLVIIEHAQIHLGHNWPHPSTPSESLLANLLLIAQYMFEKFGVTINGKKMQGST